MGYSQARGQWSPYSGEKSVDETELIRRGYLVNAARFDAALLAVLDTVKALGEWERTIALFHGDHGLSLGEYGCVGKGKLLDVDTRVPFVIRAPPSMATTKWTVLPTDRNSTSEMSMNSAQHH